MQKGKVISLSTEIAVVAAKISHQYNLHMADSFIVATAQEYSAIIWTHDVHFKDLPNVKYFEKKK